MTLPRPSPALQTFAAYAVLTVVMTWPLASQPGSSTLPNPDSYGNAWTLAWVVRQAIRDPLDLWHANIYYPHPRSLAVTESLFPEALQAAPILLLGGSPLLAHNVVLLLTFPLAALGAYLLARELSGSSSGAFLAGLGYAFCAYRLYHLVHVQSLSMQWLPFAILYLRRAALAGKTRDYVATAFFSVLQATSSGYYAVLLAAALAVALAWMGPAAYRRGTLVKLAGSVALAGILTLAAFWPYRAEQRNSRLTRSRNDSILGSATWGSYLDPGPYVGLPHLALLRRWFETEEALYPGLGVLVLAVVGAATARRSDAGRLSILLTVTGLLLSLGPEIQLGAWAVPGPYEAVRLLRVVNMLRTPSRMGVLALLGASVLAAMGWAKLMKGRRHPAIASGLVALLMAVEAFPVGLSSKIRPSHAVPEAARWLAKAPRGVVLELPWDPEHPYGGVYTYWSTAHWQPMVNGWGSFEIEANLSLGTLAVRWPRRYVSRQLRRAGVRYVLLHTAFLDRDRGGKLLSSEPLPEGVTLVATFGSDRVYEIDPNGPLEPEGREVPQ